MSAPTIFYAWDGHAMVPLGRFLPVCRREFEPGHVYRLAAHDDERSVASHRQYFVAVNEAFKNLPEEWAQEFPTPEHLRKFCLIKAGFRNETTYACASHAEALRWMRNLRKLDDYAIVVSDGGRMLTHYTAKSQAFGAMRKGEFQRSKDAVLDLLAKMLEVEPAQLTAAARAA